MASSNDVAQVWMSLTAALDLFTADLPWYASRLNKNDLSDTDRGSIEDFCIFFRYEIRQMTTILRSDRGWSHLSGESVKEVWTQLSQVLQHLDCQINDDILDICRKYERNKQNKLGFQINNGITSNLLWAISKIPLVGMMAGLPTSQAEHEQITTSPENSYPKLKALGILLSSLDSSDDPVYKFGHLINLGSKNEYKNALGIVEQFVRLLQSLDDTKPLDTSIIALKSPISSAMMAEIDKIRDASVRLFDALTLCSTDCYNPHKVMLHLTGFRNQEGTELSRPVYGMFISSCPTKTEPRWHEVQCYVSDPTSFPNTTALKVVCQAVKKYIGIGVPLHIILGGKNLFEDRTERTHPQNPPSTCFISLDELLDNGYFKSSYECGSIKPRSKSLLVLNIGRSLLCLFGSRWLQSDWETLGFVFLCRQEHQKRCFVDIHRPYVRGSLSYHVRTIDTVHDNSSVPHHDALHHPAILAFAKLLIDVERGRKISDEEYLMTNGRKNEWLTISTILTTKLSGSVSVYYTTAIQSCLNFSRMSHRDANQTDTDYIYQNIVVPLQHELDRYLTSNDSILNLENEKLHLDVTGIMDVKEAPQMFPVSQSLHLDRRTGPETSIPVREVYMQGQTAGVVLFDDFESVGNNIQLPERADNFFNLLDEWRDKRHDNIRRLQVESLTHDTEMRQARIAILDTGLDVTNPTFMGTLRRLKRKRQNGDKPIKVIKSFVGDDGKDEDGHGTLTTSILLRAAPRADIFIAKIASGRTTGQCNAIAEAITKAVDEWHVDIIVMPFGVGSERDAIKTAIGNAYQQGKILIASAANSGGNTGRAYPAEDERVICMHASDGNGNDSGGINPSPLPKEDNFTTLGLGIKFHWLNQDMWKSGTSYSAPVAAGIAANLVDFIRHSALGNELSSTKRKELRTGAVMKKLFRLLAENRNGYDYVQPWRLWKDGLEEKDVWSIIKASLLESS